MIKLIVIRVMLLLATLVLANCGGGSGSSDGSPSFSSSNDVTPNTGTVTVAALPNSIVSIGAVGTNSKVADATGKAVFTGLPAGAVDVHVFSADGYSATSYIGVNSSLVTAGGFNFVDINLTVVNPDVGGQTYYLYDGLKYRSGFMNTPGKVTFGVNRPAGSQFSATIYAAQGLGSSGAGNSTSGSYAEVLNLGTVTVTAVPTSGAGQANLTANFAAVLPVAPVLVTLNSVSPPLGLNINFANFSSVSIGGLLGFILPDTINSAIRDNGWLVSASDATTTKVWEKKGNFTAGSTMDITATMTSFPTVAANQTGSTITWTNPVGCTKSYVQIEDSTFTYAWTLNVAPNISSITLPVVPTGASSPLATGMPYDLAVYCDQYGLSFDEVVAIGGVGATYDESIGVTAVPYTR